MLARFEVPDSDSSDSSYSSSSEDSLSTGVAKPGLKRKYSSSSSSNLSVEDVPAKRVDMALSQLYMLDEKQGQPQNDSSFAKQGKNPKRVKTVLNQTCCRSKCKRKLPFKLLMHMVTIFWSLSKACQDCILWSMQQKELGDQYADSEEDSDSGSSSSKSHGQYKVSWSIEGLGYLFHVRTTPCLSQRASCQVTQFAEKPSCSWWESARPDWSGPGKHSRALMGEPGVAKLQVYWDLLLWTFKNRLDDSIDLDVSLLNARFWSHICWSSSICHIISWKSLLEHGWNFASWAPYLKLTKHPQLWQHTKLFD